MKICRSLKLNLLLVLVLLFGSVCAAAAQTAEPDEYIPVHTAEELNTLFSRVKAYLDTNGEAIQNRLSETENRVVTSALIRSWAIVQYEDAAPQQIDDAYDALYNMFLFVGLIMDPSSSLETGMMFQYAVQLLDQEYFDLLAASGEKQETIDFAEYLRGIAEALVEDPESFSEEEVEDFVLEIYQETYMASGLKAIAHTEALPLPEELFGEKEGAAMIPNPNVEYTSAEPLSEMLGIQMPALPDEYGAKVGYYTIIAEIVAETEYEFPGGEKLIFRLSPEADTDISGVYGAEFYEDRDIYGTQTEVSKYQNMLIARGNVRTMDGRSYSFAVDADGMDESRFYDIVRGFIESCMNQGSSDRK